MIKFEANKTYATRLVCDHTMTLQYRVISRTAKRMTFVKVDDFGFDDDAPITRAVREFDGREICGVDGLNTPGGVMLSSDRRWQQPFMRV